MKKFVTFILVAFVALAINAQERTVTMLTFDRGLLDKNYSYYDYIGDATYDILIPTTRDTIDIPFDTKKANGFDYNVIVSLSARAGVDTVVYIKVLGRNSLNEDYTEIQFDSSAVVTVAGVVKTLNSVKTATIASAVDIIKQQTTTNTDTITTAVRTITFNAKKEYRYITVRLILPYNDSVGTGVKVDEVELKLWL